MKLIIKNKVSREMVLKYNLVSAKDSDYSGSKTYARYAGKNKLSGFTAYVDGKIAGWVLFAEENIRYESIYPDHCKRYREIHFFVRPVFRRRGIGRAMAAHFNKHRVRVLKRQKMLWETVPWDDRSKSFFNQTNLVAR